LWFSRSSLGLYQFNALLFHKALNQHKPKLERENHKALNQHKPKLERENHKALN
jgi:hypothetical protein